MAPHGSCQTRWPNSLKRAAQIFELLGEPCGASRDYLMIKKTKSVRIDIVSFVDTTVVMGWDKIPYICNLAPVLYKAGKDPPRNTSLSHINTIHKDAGRRVLRSS
jgi:hypothetical protein